MVNEKLRNALIEAQKREMSIIPDESILSEIQIFSDEFEQKMQDMISKRKKYFYFNHFSVKKSVAVIVIIILSMTAVLSVKAIRTPIADFIIEIYEKFSRIHFEKESNEKYDINDFLYVPTVIPNGYEIIEENKYINVNELIYSNGTDEIIFEQFIIENTNMIIDTEGIKTEKVLIGDMDGLMYTNKGVSVIIWNDSHYIFSISGKPDKIMLKEMAESIELKK